MNPPLIRQFADEHQDFLRDESRRTGSAESISLPATEDEIRATLAEVRERGLTVTIQGARTGITGGAVPSGGHILNLSRMKHVVGLRQDERAGRFSVRVQPGLLLSDLRTQIGSLTFDTSSWDAESVRALAALRAAGPHFFAPDPTETSASIGGMVACNASGSRSYHYGPVRRHVESLRVVLADGGVVALRRGERMAAGRRFALPLVDGRVVEGVLPSYDFRAVKNAAGYYVRENMDLLDLFVGMEGTLGVVTDVELRLTPLPSSMWGVVAFMPTESGAVELVRALRAEKVDGVDLPLTTRPVAIEFFNSDCLELLRTQKVENPAFGDLPSIPAGPCTAVYVEYHGRTDDEVAEAVMAAAEAVTALGGNEDATWVASDAREMERLRVFRHAPPEAVNLLIDRRRLRSPLLTKLGTDMSAPDERLRDMMQMYASGLREAGIESVVFGHIGDNHVHVNILPNSDEEYAAGKRLYLQWARKVVAMGGSVSGEHGIGKLKTEFLRVMYGDDGVAQMRALKRVFDPAGILNPGNLFGDAT